MKPLGLSAGKVALALRVPLTRVTEIIRHDRSITADTALPLARCFGTTPQFWLNLQAQYDLAAAAETGAREIEREVLPLRAAGK